MKHTNRKKARMKSVVLFICIFLLFLWAATEDRLYKRWEGVFGDLLESYFSMKRVSLPILPPENLVLIDNSELKKWEIPFQHPLLGKIRKSAYFFLCPSLKESTDRLNKQDTSFFVERLNPRRIFEPETRIPPSEVKNLNAGNLQNLRKFMETRGIQYSILHYKNWWEKKRELTSARLELLHANKHFIFCTLK